MKTSIRSTGLALTLTTLAASSAWAAPTGVYDTYFVTGSAAAGAPGDGQAGSYQCNTQATVQDLAGCGVNGGRTTAGGATTYGGTTGTQGDIRAFQAQTQANGFHFEFPGNVPTVVTDPSFSRATASADLADASLHASVGNNAAGGFVSGSARADLHDIVHLQVAGADASTVTRVAFRFTLDGSVADDLQTTVFGERGSGTLNTGLRLDQLDSGNGGSTDYWLAAFGEWTINQGTLQSNNASLDVRGAHVGGSWTSFGLGAMVFDGWMDILGTEATINPTLSLSLDCSIGLQCDYSSGAHFSFVGLSSSVTYSSASGTFLTAGTAPTDPSGVPEPASAALALSALAAMRWTARRRAA